MVGASGGVSCKRGGDTSSPAEEESPLTAEAARMPGFDIEGEAPTQVDAEVPYERFYVLLGDAPVKGPEDAPVTLVAFSDFECPYCEQGHHTIKQLMREYRGKLRLTYKAFPLNFHPHAMLAALAARSAHSQGKFWEFHDLLLSQRGLDMDRIIRYAQQVNLDMDSLARDIDGLKYGVSVRRDMRQARQLGVRGTPAYFINGRFISGAKPIEQLREIIDEELALAKSWRKQGVSASETYAHAIADGYREVKYEKPSKGLNPDAIYSVPLGDSPRRGPDDALITIVEYGDFECPFCARGNATLERIRERYQGKIRVVFKNLPLPFHANAYMAARAGVQARLEGKFWEFHDAIYKTGAQFDEATLIKIGKQIGLKDMRAYKAALNSDTHDAAIAQDMALARTLGVRGTPAYFVNGRAIAGALPEMEFRITVLEELERAEAALAQGVSRAELYDHLTASAAAD